MPEEPRGSEEAEGALEAVPEVAAGLPNTVDGIIAAYREVNRESIDVARGAMSLPGVSDSLDKALAAFRPSNAFLEMVERQERLSRMLSAFASPVPNGITTLIADMNRVSGLTKMMEDALLPSRQLKELIGQFSMPTYEHGTLESSLLQSFRKLTLANSLDTSVGRLLASFATRQSTLDAIQDSWRSPFWADIKQSSLMLEQLQATTAASGILEIGSLERFNSVRLLQATGLDEAPEIAEDTAQVVELARVEILDTVELALDSVDSRLVKTWRGAKQTLKSDNPDRSRHLAVSLREMTTHLLHILAPDAAVKTWSTSEGDFHNGRPTRPARVRFIYSGYCAEVQAFFEFDVQTAIQWIDLINKETHTLDGFETDGAMEALLARFEGIALALIRGAKGFE